MIRVENLYFAYEQYSILSDISFHVETGDIVVILGKNGSGKSTLLKLLAHLLSPRTGRICYEPYDTFAKHVAWLGPEYLTDIYFTVEEIVEMGQFPHHTKQAYSFLSEFKLEALKNTLFSKLSSGEQQRTMLAKTFTQDTPIMLLDEPFEHLDLEHQIELRQRLLSCKKTTLFSSHDLNLSLSFATKVMCLCDGKIQAFGNPVEVLTKEVLYKTYHTHFEIEKTDTQVRLFTGSNP